MRNIIVTIMLILFCIKLWSQDSTEFAYKKWAPNFYKLQFAGNIGFISVGSGYSFFSKKLQTSVFYSFIPKNIAGINLHTVALKNSFLIYNFNFKNEITVAPYFGGSLSYSGYLPLQILPHLGLSLTKELKENLKSFDIYFETGSTAIYLEKYIKNHSLNLQSVINFAVGTSIYF